MPWTVIFCADSLFLGDTAGLSSPVSRRRDVGSKRGSQEVEARNSSRGGGGLQRQEVVGSAQVTEANLVDAVADDVSEVLKDRRQLQDGRLLMQFEEMESAQSAEDCPEIKHEQPFLARIALLGVSGILQQISERQVVALERHADPGIIDRRVKLFERLAHEGKFQAIGIHNRLEIFLVELPRQDLLTRGLQIEQEEPDRKD